MVYVVIEYSTPVKTEVLNIYIIKISILCQIIGDVTKENSLDPKYFKGIKKVVNAVSVIVGPKEGDTPDRQKYKQVRQMPYHMLPIFHVLYFTPYKLTFNLIFMQGIKFFEPEVAASIHSFSCRI